VLFALEFEALAIEREASVVLFAFSEGHRGLCEALEGDYLAVENGVRDEVHGLEEFGETGGDDAEKLFGADAGSGDLFGALRGQVGMVHARVENDPCQVSAFSPFGKIAICDKAALKQGIHDSAHRRLGVEPVHELVIRLIFIKTGVQYFPNVEWEPCDFAITNVHDWFLGLEFDCSL
jgi:hypothetical protein